ncbi:hypothetical protein LTR27_005957 [Elasticomyces elasticus]|nr:hypothetical protein LTR27_005957 [Elasticomyces elasticus]
MADGTPAKRQKLDDFEGILSKLCEGQSLLCKTQQTLSEGQAALAQDVAELTRTQKSIAETQIQLAQSQTELFQAQQVTNDKLNNLIDHFHAIHPIRVKSTNAGTRLTETFELLEKILLATSRDTVAAAQGVNKYFRSLIKNSKALRKQLSVPNAGTRLTTTFRVLETILMNTPMETVLFAQRVNKIFRNTIAESDQLQGKLYLASRYCDHDRLPILNPLFMKTSICHRLPFFLQTVNDRHYLVASGRDGAERLHAAVPVIETTSDRDGQARHILTWRLRRSIVAGWPGEENRFTLKFDVGHYDLLGGDVYAGFASIRGGRNNMMGTLISRARASHLEPK